MKLVSGFESVCSNVTDFRVTKPPMIIASQGPNPTGLVRIESLCTDKTAFQTIHYKRMCFLRVSRHTYITPCLSSKHKFLKPPRPKYNDHSTSSSKYMARSSPAHSTQRVQSHRRNSCTQARTQEETENRSGDESCRRRQRNFRRGGRRSDSGSGMIPRKKGRRRFQCRGTGRDY